MLPDRAQSSDLGKALLAHEILRTSGLPVRRGYEPDGWLVGWLRATWLDVRRAWLPWEELDQFERWSVVAWCLAVAVLLWWWS